MMSLECTQMFMRLIVYEFIVFGFLYICFFSQVLRKKPLNQTCIYWYSGITSHQGIPEIGLFSFSSLKSQTQAIV